MFPRDLNKPKVCGQGRIPVVKQPAIFTNSDKWRGGLEALKEKNC